MKRPRTKNRDTVFREWWNTDGQFIARNILCREVQHPDDRWEKLVKWGFTWGWESRKKQDIKKRKRK